MGFGGRCLWWLALLLYTATVRIVVNGVPGKSIRVARGLRQGDPTSPQLFVLAMEVVTLCIVKATEAGLFAPLVGCSAKQRVSIYVDDVAIFIKPQVQDTVVIRELLNIFGEASGLRINYNKTAVVLIRGEGLDSMTVKHMLRCEIGAFPRKYLGLQLTTGHLRKVHWQPILDRILAALPAWQRGLIARSGRLILIKAVVSARPIHQLLALEALVWLIEEIDRWTRAFFGRARRRLRVAIVWSLGRRCASHFATVGLGSRTCGSKVWLYGSEMERALGSGKIDGYMALQSLILRLWWSLPSVLGGRILELFKTQCTTMVGSVTLEGSWGWKRWSNVFASWPSSALLPWMRTRRMLLVGHGRPMGVTQLQEEDTVDAPTADGQWNEWWLTTRARVRANERRTFDTLVILVSWRLWKQRNARAFDNRRWQFSVEGLVEQVLADWALWTKAGLRGCSTFARVVH
ncbi:hypothetical protein QYE76_053391 [Lolium multiflorum]|uniref:Reverse transcriptase domain-containing protein n=1 Tax=Lolium multiflorum TaxID=4521 RepID=A0AAD8SVY1_LOLMU|nr:hypothetical protein QYE76_037682 [Lolium multiflorum]KAK1665232.1 hypothetical protein QYE76_053391 [Lolium multiflorum]